MPRHHRATTAWLLAHRVDCRDLVDQELARIARRLKPLEPEALAGFAPRGSWMLAVVACPGDDTIGLARWAAGLAAPDRDRVRFYLHHRADAVEVLAGWTDAGLGAPRVSVVRDFASFHKVFGMHLNDRVWADPAGR